MTIFSRILWSRVTFGLCLVLLGSAEASGTLDYQVIYKGIFSAGADLPIADLRLESRDRPGSPGMLETQLEASSVAYPLVERLFPIRYRFRNWTTGNADPRLLGFETYESTRKVRHRLYLRDDSAVGVRRYDLAAGAGRLEMAQLESGFPPVSAAAGERLFDRLGLLQSVRRQQLHEQAVYRFVVTNGRERLRYKVRVEGVQELKFDGAALSAWKLRFDGQEVGRDGRWEPAHRPLYVWLSQAPGQLPLRVDSRNGLGLFRIRLKNHSVRSQLARAGT